MADQDELEQLRARVELLSARTKELEAERDSWKDAAVKYRSVFQGVPTALALTDDLGHFVDVNPAFVRLLGYPLEDLRGRHVAAVSDPDEAEMERVAFAEVAGGVREHVDLEKTYLRRDGTWVRAHVCGSFVFDEEKKVVGSYAQVAEVASEMETTSSTMSLRAMENRNRAILDAVPDLLFLISPEGRIIDCKPSATVPLTKPVFEYIGRSVLNAFPPELAERHSAIAREVATTGERKFDEYETPDGRHEEALFARTRGGNVVLSVRDVSKRMAIEQERDRLALAVETQMNELRQWKALADRAPDAIGLLDISGVFSYANAAFAAYTGRGELVGTNVVKLLARREDQSAINKKLRSRGSFRGDLDVMRADGTTVVAHVVLFVITNERGRPTSLGCIVRDRTEEIRAEEDRRFLQEALIEGHEKLILELETPLLPVARGVLLMPMVGRVDSARIERIVTTLLSGVSDHGARVVILDITGVPVVDDDVAAGLVRAAKAVRLLGAETLLAGVGPAVARQLVSHADEIAVLRPCTTLERGVAIALSTRREAR